MRITRFRTTRSRDEDKFRSCKQMNRERTISRRRFLRASAAGIAGLGASTLLYALRWEPHWLELVERRLPIANLPDGLVGARLVQLSDLHIGRRVSESYLLHTFERVKDLAPEIVIYTGDFTCYSEDVFDRVQRLFPHLPLGSCGTVGILGNHDYGPGWARPKVAHRIAELAGEAGVRVLRNEVVEIDGLQIVGLDDLWARRFEPGNAWPFLNPKRASVVLSHNPDTVDEPVWGAYAGWILAGHTHGGQCKPPFLPPPILPVRNRRYTSGEFTLTGGRRMYINRGVGHLLRARFNVRPEVTVHQLVSESGSYGGPVAD
jgi:uncharacterized protein